MKVFLSKDGKNPEDVLGKGMFAEFTDHTNQITNKPDPRMFYAPGFSCA